MFEECFAKSGFALLGCNVNLAVVQNPAARIRGDVGSGAGQEDRADGAMIFPAYLERIFLRVPFQNVVRQVLHARTRRAETQRKVEYLGSARLDIAASHNEWIAGSAWEIRRIGHIDRTFDIVTAKIERTRSAIQLDNRNNKPRITN